ncbi:hypothetical protein ACFPTX_18060 [Pseudomonas sp. GCM10022188]|uniref:hypothetical protein n=1 Tax=Pseudomonas TaxID=286 RepID=UPI001E5E95DC|nr:hypothetical protein [Pseudomonas oryzagri]MCC6076323.1 hypothetical protein [Pseudomonas oryzagri]
MRTLLRFSACFAFGLVLAGLLLVVLLMLGQFELIKALLLSGKPLAWLSLTLVPEAFWNGLTGAVHAARNPSVRSFLELCAALAQIGLLLAAGLFRLWYRR